MESEISENNQIKIKSKQQSNEIFDAIKKREPSKILEEIKEWIDKNNPEFWNINDGVIVSVMIIDTIHSYFEKKFNKETESLIEKYLCILINRLNPLANKEILLFTSNLKTYINKEDADAKLELEKFIDKLFLPLKQSDLFRNMSDKMLSFYEKYKPTLNKTIKFQSNNLLRAKLFTEASELNSEPKNKSSLPENVFSPTKYKNATPKEKILRKKIKTRIINFDDEGIGYDHCSSHLYLKEIKRPAEISLEKEFSPQMKLEEELIRLGEIYINKELSFEELEKLITEKEFELFASKEEKEARFREEEAKKQAKQLIIKENIKNTKKFREYLKNAQKNSAKALKIGEPLSSVLSSVQKQIDRYKEQSANEVIELPSFEARKNDLTKARKKQLLTAFLRTIDYEKFKELINFSESILLSINEIKKTLNRIDVFSKSLGISLDYINALDNSRKKIIKNFSRNRIISFLEASLNLFKKRALFLDTNYCLLKIKDKKEQIEFLEPNFLSSFILKNDLTQIININIDYLDLFFNQNQDPVLFNRRCLENKNNLFKILLNFFLGEYYFLNRTCKEKFVKQFFLNSQKHPDFDSIKAKMFELKWWHFIFFGISPFYIFKKGFREYLSEKLFLNLLKEEFEKRDKEPQIKYLDDLYFIRKRLNNSNIFHKSQSISLSEINVPQSRQEIINRLNNHKDIKDLLDNISILNNNATWCVNEFSKVLNTYQQERKKNLPNFSTSKEYFFKHVATSRSFIPNDYANNFSLSHSCRSIN